MRFPGLGLSARVPDAKTIWAFRARLTKAGAIDGLSTICKTLRFVRRRDVSDASRHDGRFPRRRLLDRTNTGSGVWADSAYRSKQNEAFMAARGFVSPVHRRKPAGKPMPDHIRRGNAMRSKHRAPIEHAFADRKSVMGMTIPTIGIARAKTKIGMANIVYNSSRLAQISQRQPA